jgi:hypothetical protein
VLVLRRGGEMGWVVGCSLGGERGDGEEEGEEKGEIEEESVGRGYILTFTDGITEVHLLSVYPSVIPPVNVSRHCTEIQV